MSKNDLCASLTIEESDCDGSQAASIERPVRYKHLKTRGDGHMFIYKLVAAARRMMMVVLQDLGQDLNFANPLHLGLLRVVSPR